MADFGLSEQFDQAKDYFRQDKTDMVKMPVRWLAPECLEDGVFSEKSDIVRKKIYARVHVLVIENVQWAYGVTCWEIFSGGKIPYPGIQLMDLPSLLAEGYRMERPSNSACLDEM